MGITSIIPCTSKTPSEVIIITNQRRIRLPAIPLDFTQLEDYLHVQLLRNPTDSLDFFTLTLYTRWEDHPITDQKSYKPALKTAANIPLHIHYQAISLRDAFHLPLSIDAFPEFQTKLTDIAQVCVYSESVAEQYFVSKSILFAQAQELSKYIVFPTIENVLTSLLCHISIELRSNLSPTSVSIKAEYPYITVRNERLSTECNTLLNAWFDYTYSLKILVPHLIHLSNTYSHILAALHRYEQKDKGLEFIPLLKDIPSFVKTAEAAAFFLNKITEDSRSLKAAIKNKMKTDPVAPFRHLAAYGVTSIEDLQHMFFH